MEQLGLLKLGLTQLGLGYEDEQLEQLLAYVALLEKWRGRINLVGAVSSHDLIVKHVLDSLAIHTTLQGPVVLDLGTGAGFPGIPLAIFKPEYHYVLVDARGKRIHFLRQVINNLKIKHVDIRHERIENLQLADPANTIVSRAVAGMEQLIHWSQHLLAPTGRLVLMKGQQIESATETIESFSLRLESVEVPFLSARRQVLIAERTE